MDETTLVIERPAQQVVVADRTVPGLVVDRTTAGVLADRTVAVGQQGPPGAA